MMRVVLGLHAQLQKASRCRHNTFCLIRFGRCCVGRKVILQAASRPGWCLLSNSAGAKFALLQAPRSRMVSSCSGLQIFERMVLTV
jgi:hypothetical protein